jgi:hypothetical protein
MPHTTTPTGRPARDDRAARLHCGCPERHEPCRALLGIGYRLMAFSPMAFSPMALQQFLILKRSPPGPAFGRPEDRLRGRLEEPAPAKAGDASALIRRAPILPPPVVPAKQRATEFDRAARHLAPLAGRGRKPRIACLPGEGRLSPHPPVPCSRKGLLTPALSPPAERGSTPRLRPVDAVDHRAASLNTCPFPVIPAQAGTQSLQSRPVARSLRCLGPDSRPIEITHGSDPQTHQEN